MAAFFRHDETRATLKLAGPLIAAQIGGIALNTTDVIMMGWLGQDALAAGSLAFAAFAPTLLAGFGLTSAIAALVAQARGADDPTSVRRSIRQGAWVALAAGLCATVLIQLAPTAFRAAALPVVMVDGAEAYLRAAAFAFAPAFLFAAFRHVVAAHDQAAMILAVSAVGVVVNAIGNWILMFGAFGAPGLGLVGAGISTTIVFGVMALLLAVHVARDPVIGETRPFQRFWRPDWPRFWSIWRIGGPIGLMTAAEVSLFSGVTVIMGWIGTTAAAAHAIALQLVSVAFMVPLGISQAATIRVGYAAGRGDAEAAARAGWTAIALAVGAMALSGALFLSVPGPLAALYLDPSDPRNAETLGLAATLLAVGALFGTVDGVQVAAAGALRGLNDTAAPMWIGLAAFWGVGATSAAYLGLAAELGAVGVWFGITAGLLVVASALCWRFAARARGAVLDGVAAAVR